MSELYLKLARRLAREQKKLESIKSPWIDVTRTSTNDVSVVVDMWCAGDEEKSNRVFNLMSPSIRLIKDINGLIMPS